MTRRNPILRCANLFALALLLFCTTVSSAADPSVNQLQKIDAQREELRQKSERYRGESNRMTRRCGLAETHMELLFLDYDDPRTKLGAAIAMNNVSHEQLVEIMFEMAYARRPTEDEQRRCLAHLKEHADDFKLAIKDIIWALCNSREFVDRIDK